MPGGLMNLISYGVENIILNGDPKKTFFKVVYSRYTNFGMQKFRLDFRGQNALRMNEETTMKFPVPRYADLLNDVYVVVDLPDIWSPVYVTTDPSGIVPYEFKWIEELGANMIKEVVVLAGGQRLTNYSGEYISCVKERDFSNAKKGLFNRMTGNIADFNDPANSNGYPGYPNAAILPPLAPPVTLLEPSIRGRQLYIPLECWFCRSSKVAFPLVSTQYAEVEIQVTFRPIRELYMIRNVTSDTASSYVTPDTLVDVSSVYIAPNAGNPAHQFYHFIQQPETDISNVLVYASEQVVWKPDIHLMATYIFLDDRERQVFARGSQEYVVRLPNEIDFLNVVGPRTVNLNSVGLISSYMWRFRRSDAYTRNTWANYTNWPYNVPTYSLDQIPGILTFGNSTFFTQPIQNENVKSILVELGIVIDGKYRENVLREGVYNYVEKFLQTSGGAKDGLYCYNFCINSDLADTQPSGAMNMSKYSNVDMELTTLIPPQDPSASFVVICDPETEEPVGIRKTNQSLYMYTYDLRVFEERYNVVVFESGLAGLKYAR